MTAENFAYELQWLTPFTIVDLSKEQFVIQVTRCKSLGYPGGDDVCQIGCQQIYPHWVREQFKAEIDANRPMTVGVDTGGTGNPNHISTAIGYDESTSPPLYGIHDTWDTNVHWYQWREVARGRPWGVSAVTTYSVRRSATRIVYVFPTWASTPMWDELDELMYRFPGQYSLTLFSEVILDDFGRASSSTT